MAATAGARGSFSRANEPTYVRPIEDLSDARLAAGAVPSPLPRPDTPFDKPASPFDERRGRAPPDNNDLFSMRRDTFNLAALGPLGAAPLLYGCVKFLNSLDFDSVSRRRTFARHGRR